MCMTKWLGGGGRAARLFLKWLGLRSFKNGYVSKCRGVQLVNAPPRLLTNLQGEESGPSGAKAPIILPDLCTG